MKRKMSIPAAITCLLVINFPEVSMARPVRIWNPDELWEKADLVVIARAGTSHDERKVEAAKPDTWIPVVTEFDVQAVLKGRLEKSSEPGRQVVKVRHNRYHDSNSEITVIDGPAFVEFNPKAKNRYLIFLVGKPGGIFEPLSGQYDPWQSFLRLQEYHKSRERNE